VISASLAAKGSWGDSAEHFEHVMFANGRGRSGM